MKMMIKVTENQFQFDLEKRSFDVHNEYSWSKIVMFKTLLINHLRGYIK